jgi:hypothetical protein
LNGTDPPDFLSVGLLEGVGAAPSSQSGTGVTVMSLSRTTTLAIGTVIGFTIGASGLATSFQLRIGDAKAPGEVMGEITKLGGKEVANGAIIVRSGDKLYLVDGKPTH